MSAATRGESTSCHDFYGRKSELTFILTAATSVYKTEGKLFKPESEKGYGTKDN